MRQMYIFYSSGANISFPVVNTVYDIVHIFNNDSQKCICNYENRTDGWNNGSGEVNIGKDLYNKDLASFKFTVNPNGTNGNLFNLVQVQTTPVNIPAWGGGTVSSVFAPVGVLGSSLIILEQSEDKDAYGIVNPTLRQDRAVGGWYLGVDINTISLSGANIDDFPDIGQNSYKPYKFKVEQFIGSAPTQTQVGDDLTFDFYIGERPERELHGIPTQLQHNR